MPHFEYEQSFWSKDILVAGLDEAGRGPWAGPVVAAAVIWPISFSGSKLEGLDDSKKISPKKRQEWQRFIEKNCLSWATGLASAKEIDQKGLLVATKLACIRALMALTLKPKHLLLDALSINADDLNNLCTSKQFFFRPLQNQQTTIIKGDQISYSIAAASILAKETRDQMMRTFHQEYPTYGFNKNKGYGTFKHRQALEQYGPCPIHRFSYKPVRSARKAQKEASLF